MPPPFEPPPFCAASLDGGPHPSFSNFPGIWTWERRCDEDEFVTFPASLHLRLHQRVPCWYPPPKDCQEGWCSRAPHMCTSPPNQGSRESADLDSAQPRYHQCRSCSSCDKLPLRNYDQWVVRMGVQLEVKVHWYWLTWNHFRPIPSHRGGRSLHSFQSRSCYTVTHIHTHRASERASERERGRERERERERATASRYTASMRHCNICVHLQQQLVVYRPRASYQKSICHWISGRARDLLCSVSQVPAVIVPCQAPVQSVAHFLHTVPAIISRIDKIRVA